jgi:hypothetical protein
MARVAKNSAAPVARRRGRKPVDPHETPEMRFKRLAGERTRKILKSLEVLENCGNRSVYSYTEEQARKIIRELTEGVDSVRRALSGNFFDDGPRRARPAKVEYWDEVRARRSVRDQRTARQRYLDRNKQGRRFAQRRLGVGPR